MSETTRTAPTFPPLGEATPTGRRGIARSRASVAAVPPAFIADWLILVGGLVVAIAATGRVHTDFMLKWAPFIVGGVSITLFVSVASIVLATLFAVLGALGRLSRNPLLYATASFYVSLFRGTPLILQLIFLYIALPQSGIVLPGLAAASSGWGSTTART